jgi:DNA-binding transcriptional regulator YiaG
MYHIVGVTMSKKSKKKDRKGKHKKAAAEGTPTGFDLRSVAIPTRPRPLKPAEIRAMRTAMDASQALFARLLNVSSNAVESWEQGIRQPRQATLKLLHIARKNPAALLG